jgi:hypothetical protein
VTRLSYCKASLAFRRISAGSGNLILPIEHMNWTPKRLRITISERLMELEKGTPMNHTYDLFERFPDGSSLWRACVVGLQGTRLHMVDLARRSTNQFYAMHVGTGKIVSLSGRPASFLVAGKAGRQGRAATA